MYDSDTDEFVFEFEFRFLFFQISFIFEKFLCFSANVTCELHFF